MMNAEEVNHAVLRYRLEREESVGVRSSRAN